MTNHRFHQMLLATQARIQLICVNYYSMLADRTDTYFMNRDLNPRFSDLVIAEAIAGFLHAVTKEMAPPRKLLLQDFIIPALDSEKYSNKLYWLNKEEGIFRIYWSHKNAAIWTEEDAIVFQGWDELKGHYKPAEKNYWMCAKQRFRAALLKLGSLVRQLDCPEKDHRDYQLNMNLVKSKTKMPKRTNQSLIPTSVIEENTLCIAEPAVEDREPMSPPAAFYTPSEEEVFAQYNRSIKVMRKKGLLHENRSLEESPPKSPREVLETSVLRENSSTPRIPRIAPQPVPVYCSYKQFSSSHHSLQDPPEVFVSKIYNGPENVPPMQDDTQSSVNTTDDGSSGILDLSVNRC